MRIRAFFLRVWVPSELINGKTTNRQVKNFSPDFFCRISSRVAAVRAKPANLNVRPDVLDAFSESIVLLVS